MFNIKQFFTGMHSIEFHGQDKLLQSISDLANMHPILPGSSLSEEQR